MTKYIKLTILYIDIIMIVSDTLMVVAKIQGLSQSDLARLAGVSRQAVSLWLKSAHDGRINLDSNHLLALSRGLGLTVEELATPLPCSQGPVRDALCAELLWDRLYPSLEDFAAAVAQGSSKALARLVQAYGLFRAAKTAGRVAWTRFEDYKVFIQPERRVELEWLWRLRQSLASS